ncbi:hypothetical protein YA52_10720 [Enterobacter roggenkampii]|nr:hypothetical protein YA52_10720 [Enterobacter roggenkampii]
MTLLFGALFVISLYIQRENNAKKMVSIVFTWSLTIQIIQRFIFLWMTLLLPPQKSRTITRCLMK